MQTGTLDNGMEDLGKGDSLFVDCRVICVMARGQCLMQRGVDRMEKASVTMGPFQAYQHFDMDTFQGQKPDEDFSEMDKVWICVSDFV